MTDADATVDGLISLPQMNPVDADIINLMIQLLNGGEIEGAALTLDVKAAKAPLLQTGWFSTRSEASFCIIKVHAKAVVLDPSRVEAAAAALDAIDPVLDQLEAVLGIALEPLDLLTAPITDAILIEIACRDGQDVRHVLQLAAKPSTLNLAHMNAARSTARAALRDAPCPFTITATAADLSIDDASDLACGDLLIIGSRASTRLQWPAQSADGDQQHSNSGWLDLTTGLYLEGDNMSANPGRGGFAVPVTIALPPKTTSVEVLANLKPGATLPLGPITAGLIVDVQVGGRALARGELVQIGDQFAVLIEERLDLPYSEESQKAEPEPTMAQEG
jgi:hypothetical protein